MLKFNNSIVSNKVRIGWHFSSNKYAYRDVYSALKSIWITSSYDYPVSWNRGMTSDLHGPMTSDLHGPMTSNLHGSLTSDLHGPVTSDLHEPMTSDLHGPMTSDLHGPMTSDLHGVDQ